MRRITIRKRNTNLTKSTANRFHFRKRVFERFGIRVTREEEDELVARIMANLLHSVGRQSNNKTVYRLEVQGKEFFAIYDKQRHTFVTALPPGNEYETNYRHNQGSTRVGEKYVGEEIAG